MTDTDDAANLTLGPGSFLTPAVLKAIMPKAPAGIWAPALSGAMLARGIVGPRRVAHFLAQLAHESVELTRTSENLNYSAEGLLRTFPRYFDATTAADYARHPERIANHVYAGRHGNGDAASGDGFRYRGGGPMQLTFLDNYMACGDALAVDLVTTPDLVRTDPVVGAASAAWFWETHDLSRLADVDDVYTITKRINGGSNGLDARKHYLTTAKAVLGAK